MIAAFPSVCHHFHPLSGPTTAFGPELGGPQLAPAPEPESFALLAVGGFAVFLRRRKPRG